MEEIPYADAERGDLPENRGKCSAGHTHIQPEDEQRIKDRIDKCADEHRHHGIARAAICQNQLAHAGIHNEKRKPQRCDASVGLCVGQNIRRSAEEFQHRRQKKQRDRHQHSAEQRHQAQAVACIFSRTLFIACTQLETEIRRTADTEQQRNGCAGNRERKRNVRGSIAQQTHTLPDKDLVNNVVQRRHQHRDNAGNGKADKQLAFFFISKRIGSISLR